MNRIAKIAKIALGSSLAIFLANSLGLLYPTSAGIIALLTIQDTKKQTLLFSIQRIISFLITCILSILLFSFLSYHIIVFGLFLLIFVGFCYSRKYFEAISTNAVLATHFLIEESVSPSMIANEALLLLIGAGIGTVLNLFIGSNVKQIRNKQEIIEKDLKTLLSRMSTYLVKVDKSEYTPLCFAPLEAHIQLGLHHAYTNMNNTFFQESQYFIGYMELRKQQLQVLREVYEKIMSLSDVYEQSYNVASFITEISDSFAESNNAKDLLCKQEQIYENFHQSPLPATRIEFEDRAILYMILKDFRILLKMKETFAESLTNDQVKKYWSHE